MMRDKRRKAKVENRGRKAYKWRKRGKKKDEGEVREW